MKKIIPALILVSFVFAACAGDEKANEANNKDKYEQTKETLEQTEKKNPKRFLTVEGSDRKNLIGQRVIKGTISNKASVASYKDVDIELSFYSETGALLEKDHEIIYETITAGNSTNFKTKYFAPKGTDSVVMKIAGAKVE
jgi:ABC-type Fe3+-hydroxamate transport system substrate-binding protein